MSKTQRTLLSLMVVLGLGGVVLAAVPTMPFDEVQPGMTGTGRTVFAGTEISTFQVEILGKLPNIGPDQNLILARCSGGPLAETGVLSGMSGSPVFIDGRLIGAVAYSWGFSKEAIAGITPIEEMLAISELSAPAPSARNGGLQVDRALLAPMTNADSLRTFFEKDLWPVLGRGPGTLALSVPLSIAGIGAAGLARVAPGLERAGFTPVQSGSYGRSAAQPPPLEPGSPIGVQLVRGDLEMTATGTVTWVDGDRVLAFGHPLFGLGPIDLPLTARPSRRCCPA